MSEAKDLPEHKGWPLLGEFPRFIRKGGMAFLEENRRRYGDLYQIRLGPLPVVIANHPSHARHVLRDHVSNYYKGDGLLWQHARDIFGNGLVASEGDLWLRQRRMMQPQFHRRRIAALAGLMIDAIEESLRTWRIGVPVDLVEELSVVAMRVISKTMFGQRLTAEETSRVSLAFTTINNYAGLGILGKALPRWMPKPGRKRFLAANEEVDVIIHRLIRSGREAMASEEAQNNLLFMLLQLTAEDGTGMTDAQLRDEVITIFAAGFVTTASVLAWTILLLLKNSLVFQRLQQEIDALSDDPPSGEDLSNLSYTKQVFQEALRLRPPVEWVSRTAKDEDVLDEFRIPAGRNIILPIYIYHHHPDFWEEPESFRPERFSPANIDGTFAWLPFGTGPHVCLGKDFAILEAQLVLAMLLKRYRLTLLKEATRKRFPVLARSARGVWIRLDEKN